LSEYDYKLGTVIRVTDLNGNFINYKYDSFGRTKKVWGPYLDPATDNLGTLSMEYYPEEKPARAVTKNREDYETTRTLDTVIFIDSLRRVIQTKKESEVNQNGQAVLGYTTTGRVEFDEMGRVTRQGQPVFEPGVAVNYLATIPMKNPAIMTYDDMGRTIKVQTPDGSITQTGYSIQNGSMKTIVVDQNGNKKESYSDIYGKIQKIREYNGANAIETHYDYNAIGEILTVTDAKGNKTTVDYDTLGRRTAIDNPDAGRTEFTYDLVGNLIEKVDAKLKVQKKSIQYVYEYSRLNKIDYPAGEVDVEYFYGTPNDTKDNRAGRITKIVDESGATELFYGKLGETTRTDKILPLFDGTTGRFSTHMRFDSFARMKQITYPDGEVLDYTYDEGGLLQHVESVRDNKNVVYLEQLGYDEYGQRNYLELGNGAKTTYAYNPLNRRLSNLKTISGSEKIQDINYTYDKVGNILSIKDNIKDSLVQDFEYDDLYRLTKATGSFKYHVNNGYKSYTYNREYGYDKIHNMTRKMARFSVTSTSGKAVNDPMQNYDMAYSYNGEKPHAISQVDITYTDSRQAKEPLYYTFDENGNQINRENGQTGELRDMTWSSENRLQAVNDQKNRITKFTYDAGGERVRKQGPNGETLYINQFYTVTDDYVGSSHIYAGSIRIATRVTAVGKRMKVIAEPVADQPQTLNDYIGMDGVTITGKGKDLTTSQNSSQTTTQADTTQTTTTGKQRGKSAGKGKGQGKDKNADKGKGKGKNTTSTTDPCQDLKGFAKRDCEEAQGTAKGNQGKGGNNTNAANGRYNTNANTDNKGVRGPSKAQGKAVANGYYDVPVEDRRVSDGNNNKNNNQTTTKGGGGRGSGATKGKAEVIYFYHADHLGSTSLITDADGAKYERTLYYPFGEIWFEDAKDNSNFDVLGYKFTGKELDEETGYYYFGARYYDPKVGVWLSTDPALSEYLPKGEQVYFPEKAFNAKSLKGSGGVFNSVNANLYHYAGVNPVKLIDPDGRQARPSWANEPRPEETTKLTTTQKILVGVTTVAVVAVSVVVVAKNLKNTGSLRGIFSGMPRWVQSLTGMFKANNIFKFANVTKQVGTKLGRHWAEFGLKPHEVEKYMQIAKNVMRNSKTIITRFAKDAKEFAGETHYRLGDTLLRLDAEGKFRSLYKIKDIPKE
ncbi:MAG: RHS repeat-associated core domain-containing protein, partial [Leptospirales bacterium]